MAKRNKRPYKKPTQTPLGKRVRVINSSSAGQEDRIDNDPSSYVAPFLKSLHEQLPLERIDLRSKETAAQSLSYLEEKLSFLQRQLHTARSLRKLLEEKKAQLLYSGRLDDKNRDHH